MERYKHAVASAGAHLADADPSASRVGNGLPSSPTNTEMLLDWLDRLLLAQTQGGVAVGRLQYASSGTGASAGSTPSTVRVALSPEMQDLYSYCCLVVDMPMFPHPVLHDDKLYPSVTPHLPEVAFQMLTVNGGVGPRSAFTTEKGEAVYEFNLIGKPFSGEALRHIVDWEMEADNPCEDLHRRLAHDTIRGRGGVGDSLAKPNLQEKERLDKILRTPGDHLRAEDKDLMYRFRCSSFCCYSFCSNTKGQICAHRQ